LIGFDRIISQAPAALQHRPGGDGEYDSDRRQDPAADTRRLGDPSAKCTNGKNPANPQCQSDKDRWFFKYERRGAKRAPSLLLATEEAVAG
jgi:hypothetical protein